MRKTQDIADIISTMKAAATEQQAVRDATYFKALGDKKFAAADSRVRELVRNPKAKKSDIATATAERDALFAKFFKPGKDTMCELCSATGYTKGKLCKCVMAGYTRRLMEQSGVDLNTSPVFCTKTFDEKTAPAIKKVYTLLQTFCDKFPNTARRNIVLCGGTGTGKTHAVRTMAARVANAGHSVIYTTAFDLVQIFGSHKNNWGVSDKFDAVLECDLLIIDDLGSEPQIKNITQEYLFNLVNQRTLHGRHMVVTTNMDVQGLFDTYDQRTAGRLVDKSASVVINMPGSDLRLKR